MNRIRIIGETILGYHGFFSLDRVKRDTKISASYCTNTLFKFCKEGLIKKASKRRKEYGPKGRIGFVIIYLVVDRKGLAARIGPKLKNGPIMDRAWSVIRNKFRACGAFSLRDVVVLAGVKKSTAKCYLKRLRRAGIIDRARRTSCGFEWRLTGKHSEPSRPYLEYESLSRAGAKNTKNSPL